MGKGPQYHEIGRSIATLMTDEVSQNGTDFKYLIQVGLSNQQKSERIDCNIIHIFVL